MYVFKCFNFGRVNVYSPWKQELETDLILVIIPKNIVAVAVTPRVIYIGRVHPRVRIIVLVIVTVSRLLQDFFCLGSSRDLIGGEVGSVFGEAETASVGRPKDVNVWVLASLVSGAIRTGAALRNTETSIEWKTDPGDRNELNLESIGSSHTVQWELILSWMVMEGHGRSFPIIRFAFQVRKVMCGLGGGGPL